MPGQSTNAWQVLQRIVHGQDDGPFPTPLSQDDLESQLDLPEPLAGTLADLEASGHIQTMSVPANGTAVVLYWPTDRGRETVRRWVEQQDRLQQDIAALRSKVANLTTELQAVADISGTSAESDIDTYITQLHTYNEIKDFAQAILGKCAEIEGTTAKAMHEKFGADFED
ncbi:swi5-like zinc finger protein [Dimargaris verticillata]|uniref:Swi5-like zinc finger protein n=1 Tax=Dimargaris verticillata TaxID=2761393 RepID=A0A9W8B3B7_9FUNG|nr:swi5-like zinc finger protein [Dimargaris verticillata]